MVHFPCIEYTTYVVECLIKYNTIAKKEKNMVKKEVAIARDMAYNARRNN